MMSYGACAQDESHAFLLQCVRESPIVAEAYANVLAAKGNPYNISAAINLLTDAIGTLPNTPMASSAIATINAPPLTTHKKLAIRDVIMAARQAKISEDVVYEAFTETRGHHSDDANNALIAAIQEARIAISTVSDSLESARTAIAASNADTPEWKLELFDSAEFEADFTRLIIFNIDRSTQFLNTAEEAVFRNID
jgi:hypothetical protein